MDTNKAETAFGSGSARASRALCRALAANRLADFKQKKRKLTKLGLLGEVSRGLAFFVVFCFNLIWLSLSCATAFAQTTSDNVAEREVQRRQARKIARRSGRWVLQKWRLVSAGPYHAGR